MELVIALKKLIITNMNNAEADEQLKEFADVLAVLCKVSECSASQPASQSVSQ